MKRLYIDRAQLDRVLNEITKAQAKVNCFTNVEVKPYTGKKYDPRNTCMVVIG